jgi:hypothetical protein
MAYTTINKPSLYFNTLLWSGTSNSSARSFTGVGFKPDWVWQKVRTTTYGHEIFDIIRTTNRLVSSTANAETPTDQYGYISTFDTDGFTAIPGSTDNTGWNEVGQNYVAWNWLGANTTVSNTSGTITSTVCANTTSGFSVVGYTGNGTSGPTFGHGLGVAPKLVIIKNRQATEGWPVWLNNTTRLILNTTAGNAGNFPISTSSTLITLPNFDGLWNSSGVTYIAYCFAEVRGYSKFATYTGNASANGTFIYTGFKPAFILIKRTDSTADWYLQDNVRNQNFNGDPKTLQPNTASTEATIGTWSIDNLSNGFKIRESNAAINASGGTYLYMAFAENPFVSSTFIPTTAR